MDQSEDSSHESLSFKEKYLRCLTGAPIYETNTFPIQMCQKMNQIFLGKLLIFMVSREQRVKLFHLFLFMVPGHNSTVDPASQDLFGPEFVVQTDRDSETPELLPAIPFQRSADTPHTPDRPQEVFPHVQFLQSLCALQRVRGDDHGLEPLWFPPDGDAASLLADSVCQLLDSLVKACRDPPPFGPGDPVLQACQVVAQATDLFCSQRLPSVEFKRSVESSLEELTEMLLHRDLSSQVSDPMGGGGVGGVCPLPLECVFVATVQVQSA